MKEVIKTDSNGNDNILCSLAKQKELNFKFQEKNPWEVRGRL